jgi:pimeloyl-ACP methyl ester carboxylesterase
MLPSRMLLLVLGVLALGACANAVSGEPDGSLGVGNTPGGTSGPGANTGFGATPGVMGGADGSTLAGGGGGGAPGGSGSVAAGGRLGTGGRAEAPSIGGDAGRGGTVGTGLAGGASTKGGSASTAATAGTAGAVAGAASKGTGECCSDGDCLCHGPAPSEVTSKNGPFKTETFTISTGTVHYPTDAEPPFAAVALCGGFLNTGPEMAPWGPFYASHGIVTVITTTTGIDLPDLRATKLLASIEAINAENTKSGSPLHGKLAGRYGTSGYSMGGGGTTIASGQQPTLKTSVGLAPWAPTGANVKVPTLLLCGASDTVAPCSHAQGAYTEIAESTPKMMVTIPDTSHLQWFGPTDAGAGISGEAALVFQKVYLEGDERWKPLLSKIRGTVTTNIQ